MANLKEYSISLLASTTANLQNGDGDTVLYTVPQGKVAHITHAVIRDPTASLAGGTDFDIGDDENTNWFKEAFDLSSMTTSGTDYMVITNDNAVLSEYSAGTEIELVVTTGATADASATIDLFGYLV